MVYHIYLYQKNTVEYLQEIFDKMDHLTRISMISNSMMKVSIHSEIIEDNLDLEMIHASMTTDFETDIHMLYLYDNVHDLIEESMVIEHLPHLKNKVYDISDFLIYLSHFHEGKMTMKRKSVELLGQDYINTIIMLASTNMNNSIAAKRLYLHRNSLNYRIDKIYQLTGVDIKTFKGLRAFISILES